METYPVLFVYKDSKKNGSEKIRELLNNNGKMD